MLFGVLSAEAGLGPWETQIFSVAVFAGASQLAALQLMQDQAPVLVILATGLAVNLRMMMYSVALAPHFGAAPLGLRTHWQGRRSDMLGRADVHWSFLGLRRG